MLTGCDCIPATVSCDALSDDAILVFTKIVLLTLTNNETEAAPAANPARIETI